MDMSAFIREQSGRDVELITDAETQGQGYLFLYLL
jgi:hypothetical protein